MGEEILDQKGPNEFVIIIPRDFYIRKIECENGAIKITATRSAQKGDEDE